MADLHPFNSNAISDDDELASVLAGVKNEAAALDAARATPDTQVNDIASLPSVPPAAPPAPAFDFEETVAAAAPPIETPIEAPVAQPAPVPAPAAPAITTPVAASPELEALKKETLQELRPLVGKLELPAEEKFDTLLLIIRSTDDQSLLAPAHDAARAITDEGRRASALLDIIKEIDYFSAKA